jgi:hypothetical protein
LLISELQLSQVYARQTGDKIPAEGAAYRKRVVEAAKHVKAYLDNMPDRDIRLQHYDMLMRDIDKSAACDMLKISKGTYTNWTTAIVRAFGKFMGMDGMI